MFLVFNTDLRIGSALHLHVATAKLVSTRAQKMRWLGFGQVVKVDSS